MARESRRLKEPMIGSLDTRDASENSLGGVCLPQSN